MRLIAHGERDVIMIIVASSEDGLNGIIKELIDKCKEDPCIFMKNPSLSRFKPTFPKNVLERVFADLPDRRIKLR